VSKTWDLSGVHLKLDRAKEHIETVRGDLKAFLESNPEPFGIRVKEERRAGDAIDFALHAIIREQPPRELALPIGDAIHNMRAALDHLAYELASKRARKAGTTAFPIFEDECRFKVLGLLGSSRSKVTSEH
jgi:hypothetical protein